jgi:hypothetical protein
MFRMPDFDHPGKYSIALPSYSYMLPTMLPVESDAIENGACHVVAFRQILSV